METVRRRIVELRSGIFILFVKRVDDVFDHRGVFERPLANPELTPSEDEAGATLFLSSSFSMMPYCAT